MISLKRPLAVFALAAAPLLQGCGSAAAWALASVLPQPYGAAEVKTEPSRDNTADGYKRNSVKQSVSP